MTPPHAPCPSLLHPLMKLHFSRTRVGFLELWRGLGYGQKPLSSAPIILFYKILGCDYIILKQGSSLWKAVCPEEGGVYFQSGGHEGNNGKILLYSSCIRITRLLDRNAKTLSPIPDLLTQKLWGRGPAGLNLPFWFFWCTLRVENLWSGRRRKEQGQPDVTLQGKDAGVRNLNSGWCWAPMRTPANVHCTHLNKLKFSCLSIYSRAMVLLPCGTLEPPRDLVKNTLTNWTRISGVVSGHLYF